MTDVYRIGDTGFIMPGLPEKGETECLFIVKSKLNKLVQSIF